MRCPVKIDYYEEKQNASVKLFWLLDSGNMEIIPQNNLFSSKGLKKGDGLSGVYRSMKQYIGYTRNYGNLYAILLEWPDKELVLPVKKPAADTKVTMLGRERELPWRHENDTLYIDLSVIKYNEMPDHNAWTIRIDNMCSQ